MNRPLRIGKVTGDSKPSYFVFSINPDTPPPLYEYVYVELEEIPPGQSIPHRVKVLAQVREIRRYGIGISPSHPWDVIKDVPKVALSDLVVGIAHVLGYKYKGKIYYPRHAPTIGSWVYLAPDDLIREFYSIEPAKGLHIGYLITRPSVPVMLNMDGIRRHLAIIAATGSGKTWTSIVLIEELLKKGATILVLDPHGEYVKIKESIHKLRKYNESVDAFVLKGHKNQEGDVLYRVSVLNMTADELASVARIPPTASRLRAVLAGAKEVSKVLVEVFDDPKLGGLKALQKIIESAIASIESVKAIKRGSGFEDFYNAIKREFNTSLGIDLKNLENNEKLIVKLRRGLKRLWLGLRKDIDPGYDTIRYLETLRKIGVYTTTTIPLEKVLKPSQVTIFNLSGLRKEVQDHLVYSILSRVFNARVRYCRGLRGEKYPYPVVIVLEEAHRFAPPKHLENTWSRDVIAKIASEGRKFGVFLIVITQRPSKVDSDILSQCQSQIILRIVNPRDQEAVRDASEEMSQELLSNLPGLNPGEAIVLGPIACAPVMVRVRDRELEYAGADIDVLKEWSKAMGEASIRRRLIEQLKEITEVTGGHVSSIVDVVSKSPKIINDIAATSLDEVSIAISFIANENIDLEFDEPTLTLKGKVHGETAEVKLSEGIWSCTCGRENIVCRHVLALLFKAIIDGIVNKEVIRKALSLRPLNIV